MTFPVPGSLPMVVPADDVPGPEQGHWTYNDYVAIPDDGQRYEVINGVLFRQIKSPSALHQEVVGEFLHYLLTYVKDAQLGRVYIGPFDVELAPDTVVQPDILIVLNANLGKITETHVIGAPDIVIEVTLPGSEGYDWFEKYKVYERSGVPEYWVVQPADKAVEVFVLEEHKKYRSFGLYGVHEQQTVVHSRVLSDFIIPADKFFTQADKRRW